MRNSVFGVALLVLVLGCGSAWAPDPAAAATYCWTGFYAGLNIGAAKNNSWYAIDPPGLAASGGFDNPAFTAGGQAGYNYQAGNWVFGLETDFNYNSTDDSRAGIIGALGTGAPVGLPPGFPCTVSQQIDYFGTLRGRLGYTPADRLLLYVTGGFAYGYVSSRTNVSVESITYSGSSSGMQPGWTIGAGGEYAFTNNWSVRLEYLYIDLGSTSYSFAGYPYSYTTTLDTAQHVIRVGLNYKF